MGLGDQPNCGRPFTNRHKGQALPSTGYVSRVLLNQGGHLRCLWSLFADLDLAVPETTRLDSSLHKARAQLLAKGRRHRPSRSRLRDSASSAEDGEGSDGPGGKVGVTYTHTHVLPLEHTPSPPPPCFQGSVLLEILQSCSQRLVDFRLL